MRRAAAPLLLGAAALAALAIGTCGPRETAPIAAVTPPATAVETIAIVATPAPDATATQAPAKKSLAAASKKKKKQKKLQADVKPTDFEVSSVGVKRSGYTAQIDGWIRNKRRGTLAQPLLEYQLRDRDGNVLHSGTFTPVDATGPVWLGADELGLKRVPFSTQVALAAGQAPLTAQVTVVEVVDAKPAKR